MWLAVALATERQWSSEVASRTGTLEERAGMSGQAAQRRTPGEGRTENLKVRLSATERSELQQRAAARGVSVARLLVESALEKPLPAPNPPAPAYAQELVKPVLATLDAVRRDLAPIGNNINQMAHGANITREIAATEQLEDALGAYRTVIGQLIQVSSKLEGMGR